MPDIADIQNQGDKEELGVAAQVPPLSGPSDLSPASGSSQSSIANAAGFGGRTFTAKGGALHADPLQTRKLSGSTGISLGFPFAELWEHVNEREALATDLAAYLSCPMRAAAPDLMEALTDLLENPAYQTAIGGNPTAVDQMLARARAALAKARGEKPDAQTSGVSHA